LDGHVLHGLHHAAFGARSRRLPLRFAGALTRPYSATGYAVRGLTPQLLTGQFFVIPYYSSSLRLRSHTRLRHFHPFAPFRLPRAGSSACGSPHSYARYRFAARLRYARLPPFYRLRLRYPGCYVYIAVGLRLVPGFTVVTHILPFAGLPGLRSAFTHVLPTAPRLPVTRSTHTLPVRSLFGSTAFVSGYGYALPAIYPVPSLTTGYHTAVWFAALRFVIRLFTAHHTHTRTHWLPFVLLRVLDALRFSPKHRCPTRACARVPGYGFTHTALDPCAAFYLWFWFNTFLRVPLPHHVLPHGWLPFATRVVRTVCRATCSSLWLTQLLVLPVWLFTPGWLRFASRVLPTLRYWLPVRLRFRPRYRGTAHVTTPCLFTARAYSSLNITCYIVLHHHTVTVYGCCWITVMPRSHCFARLRMRLLYCHCCYILRLPRCGWLRLVTRCCVLYAHVTFAFTLLPVFVPTSRFLHTCRTRAHTQHTYAARTRYRTHATARVYFTVPG